MEIKELIQAGKLTEARGRLVESVKASPADPGYRIMLFQVLCFFGEWDKAGKHLDVVKSLDDGMAGGVQLYHSLIQAEKERIRVLGLQEMPSFMPETPAYFEDYYSGLKYLADGKTNEAKNAFTRVNKQRPVISGSVNKKDFKGFIDTDSSLAFVLEAMVYERYLWIPFESIREIVIEAPSTLFDLIWVSANITTWEGLSSNCYLPVLYPKSYSSEDDMVKLGRMTEWMDLGDGMAQGMGRHVFQLGDDDMSILEIRKAVFNFNGSKDFNSGENKND